MANITLNDIKIIINIIIQIGKIDFKCMDQTIIDFNSKLPFITNIERFLLEKEKCSRMINIIMKSMSEAMSDIEKQNNIPKIQSISDIDELLKKLADILNKILKEVKKTNDLSVEQKEKTLYT